MVIYYIYINYYFVYTQYKQTSKKKKKIFVVEKSYLIVKVKGYSNFTNYTKLLKVYK